MHTQPEQQLTALCDGLRRYVPGQQMDAMLARPGLNAIRSCAEHLDALLRAVATYLPRYLVNELLADPRPGQVSGQFREATIMFADISGFTAMSERLSQQGEKGAEMITHIVGDYFTRMLDITACQGGDLLKFGGDALLVAFFGDGKPETVDHALNACRAAIQMQEAIARFSQVEAFGEIFHLKMTVGLGSGLLFTANLGTAEKMEYTVMGEALANMAHAEDQAEGGEIFIDENTRQAVKQYVRTSDVRNGCYRVTFVEGSDLRCTDRPPSWEHLPRLPGGDTAAMAAHLRHTVTCLDALSPFLPPGLLDLLRFDPARMASREKGEFRPVTVMFANFYGIEEIIAHLGVSRADEITAILNTHFTRMQEVINRYEGVIDKVDSYVVGHRIMAMFGAPRTHIDDPERAVRAAWEMQAAMAIFAGLPTTSGVLALKQRIGINTGRVFAGNVGSEMRHEYSVMGDEVNLTARLMSAAQEGQILISQSTANQIGKQFRLGEKTPVKVKGKSHPVPNYEVCGMIEHYKQPLVRRSPLIGRDDEWPAVWQVAHKSLQGHGQVLDIHGDMGMGKSRILEELVQRWAEQGGNTFFTASFSYGRHTPYAPWLVVLRDLFSLREEDDDLTRSTKIVSRLAAVSVEWADWSPLIAQLLGMPMSEGDSSGFGLVLKSLDPKLRQQNLQRIIGGLLTSEVQKCPLLLILDDVQWADEASLALLNYLTAHVEPHALLICVAYRTDEPVHLAASKQENYVAVELKALSDTGSMELLGSQLPTEPEIPGLLKQVILKNAQGTPLFIVEMAHALIENYLSYDAASGMYRARADLARVQVPDTVSRVILSRLDRLDEQSRNMLKVASVIGRAFQQWLLQSVYPYHAQESEMQANLLALCEKEILDYTSAGTQVSADVAYLFHHVMTREVAYESLLYAERRELHQKIAESIQAQVRARGGCMDEYIEVLADHYTLAEDWPRALAYQIWAGQRAQGVYANQDAIHRYQQALDVAQHVPDSFSDQLTASEGLGDIYELLGQYAEALQQYEQARTLLNQMPASTLTQRYRADMCRKTGRVYELQGDYEAALEWIRRGLALIGASECIETAQLYLGGAAVFQREGQWPEVIHWCQQSLDIVEKLDQQEARQVVAHAYYLLGNSHRRLGDTSQAQRDYDRSLETYCALDDQPGTARVYNNLANLNLDQGNWAQASDYYKQALAILERIGDLPSQAILSNNLGGVLLNQGKLKNARIYYLQGLKLSQELGISFGVALLNNNLGHTAIREGEGPRALTCLRQSLDGFEKIGSQEFLPELYRHFAEAYLLVDDREQSQRWAEKSLERAVSAQLKLEEGCTRRVLGRIHRQNGALAIARQELEHSLELLDKLENPYQAAKTRVELAALYDDLGMASQAAELRRQATNTFERLGAELDLKQVKT